MIAQIRCIGHWSEILFIEILFILFVIKKSMEYSNIVLSLIFLTQVLKLKVMLILDLDQELFCYHMFPVVVMKIIY